MALELNRAWGGAHESRAACHLTAPIGQNCILNRRVSRQTSRRRCKTANVSLVVSPHTTGHERNTQYVLLVPIDANLGSKILASWVPHSDTARSPRKVLLPKSQNTAMVIKILERSQRCIGRC